MLQHNTSHNSVFRLLVPVLAGIAFLSLPACRTMPPAELPAVEMTPERFEMNRGRPRNNQIFDIDTVTQITISVTAAEWNRLLEMYDIYPKNEEIVQARLEISGNQETQAFGEVGLGLRGNTSRRRPEGDKGEPHDPENPAWRSAHFKLDLNSFVPGQKYLGIDKLILKWPKDDGTRIREVYSFDLFRRFGVATAPRASFAHLTIRILEPDGTWTEAPYGVYSMIEAVNSDYIQARVREGVFGSRDGWLFKCLWPSTLEYSPVLARRIGVEHVSLDPAQTITYPYDLKTPKDDIEQGRTALIDFIQNLNTLDDAAFATWISRTMDVDLFLKTLAVNVAVGSWDDYWNLSSNYYLYLERDGRVHYIPYDFDNTLGTGLAFNNFDPGTRSPFEWGMEPNRPLVNRILAIPGYRELYRKHLGELIDPVNDLFNAANSIERVSLWRTMLESWAKKDVTMGIDTGDGSSPGWDVDIPAEWGLVRPYRLLSGDDDLDGSKPNYFMIRNRTLREAVSGSGQ